jgi:hypothetical protein
MQWPTNPSPFPPRDPLLSSTLHQTSTLDIWRFTTYWTLIFIVSIYTMAGLWAFIVFSRRRYKWAVLLPVFFFVTGAFIAFLSGSLVGKTPNLLQLFTRADTSPLNSYCVCHADPRVRIPFLFFPKRNTPGGRSCPKKILTNSWDNIGFFFQSQDTNAGAYTRIHRLRENKERTRIPDSIVILTEISLFAAVISETSKRPLDIRISINAG